MKILVTGSEGYIGSRLVAALGLAGHDVVRFDAKLGDNILNLAQLDEAVEGCDWIVHLAGIVGIAACEKNPYLAFKVNVDGTESLLHYRKNMIYTSVLAGYKEDVIDEETPVCPSAVYYKTKLQAEGLVKAVGQTVLRFGALYGVNPYVYVNGDGVVASKAMRDDLLVHSFCREAVQTGKITLFQPDHMRPITYLDDAVGAIKFFLTYSERAGIFNVVTTNLRKLHIAAIVRRVTGCTIESIAGADDEERNYAADTFKLRATGFRLGSPSLNRHIREICDWYK